MEPCIGRGVGVGAAAACHKIFACACCGVVWCAAAALIRWPPLIFNALTNNNTCTTQYQQVKRAQLAEERRMMNKSRKSLIASRIKKVRVVAAAAVCGE
jgi:hypothetical protein